MSAELTPERRREIVAQAARLAPSANPGRPCGDCKCYRAVSALLRALDAANAEVARLKALVPTEAMVRAAAEEIRAIVHRTSSPYVHSSGAIHVRFAGVDQFAAIIRRHFRPEPTPGGKEGGE